MADKWTLHVLPGYDPHNQTYDSVFHAFGVPLEHKTLRIADIEIEPRPKTPILYRNSTKMCEGKTTFNTLKTLLTAYPEAMKI